MTQSAASSAATVMAPGSPVQSIPYRTGSPITVGSALSVLGLTITLLAAVIGLMLLARKLGWLRRWSLTERGCERNLPALRVIGHARLGQASHAFVIETEGSRFLVVESSRQIHLQPLAAGARAGESNA